MADLTSTQVLELDNMCEGAKRATLGTRAKAIEDKFKEVDQEILDIQADIGDLEDEINLIPQVLVSAVAGDLAFKVTPATSTADIVDQNIGEQQVVTGTISGVVASDGAGNIEVTVTADGMTDSPKTVTVAVANDDDAAAIGGKIRTALIADADVGHVSTGFFTVTGEGAAVILTAKLEAENDLTMDIEVVEDDAVFPEGTPLAIAVVATEDGVAPYIREVTVELVDTEGNLHYWFSGTVPVTIADNASGTASVIGGLNPTMTNGIMNVEVALRGTWANANTNTFTVAQKSILGATVTAKTSVETSEE
jgi:hypothetical protein